MIHISDAAKAHFINLLSRQKKETQIRIFVTYPGTINAECGVSYCSPETIQSTDISLKFNQLTIYIDKLSAPYLRGAEIDFVKTELGSKLTFKAPNAKLHQTSEKATSSLVERIKSLLESQINPQLAYHGGKVSLVKITNKNCAILEFSGGCNGCSMANVTLKEGVARLLFSEFPELKEVQDLTEHRRGEHSYY